MSNQTTVRIVLVPFLVLAVVGLVLSVIVHLTTLIGSDLPLGGAAWWLHFGLLAVALPAVLTANQVSMHFNRWNDAWRVMLRSCPRWMRWTTCVFFPYAFLNFLVFVTCEIADGTASGAEQRSESWDNTPPRVFRGFSGHWMAGYSWGIVVLYSAIVTPTSGFLRRCPNGHTVTPSAGYCEACGVLLNAEGSSTASRT